MDLYRPMHAQSRGVNQYIFVIVDDYTKFTWTFFMSTKEETFDVFIIYKRNGEKEVEARFNRPKI